MYKETIWITGADGRLGSALTRYLQSNMDYKIIATDKECDITNLEEVEQSINIYRPTIIINCAGLTDVEYCNAHKVEAFKINAIGARNIAIAARQLNCKLIHMSSDDVFDHVGSEMLSEFDDPKPSTIYGQSKLAGEKYIREMTLKHVVIRSSWLYGDSMKASLGDILRKGKAAESFDAPVDVISTPTSLTELVKFIDDIIVKPEYGVFHVSCAGACSRFEYAQKALELAGYDKSLVNGVYANAGGVIKTTNLENLMVQITETYKPINWVDALEAQIEYFKEEGLI